MRLMSFALTTEQVRRQEKTVTRRLGWKNLKPGTLIQPVVKGQGLKRGEKVQRIGGPIRVVSVRRERLGAMSMSGSYGMSEVRAEGFPHMTYLAFIDMFCKHNGCKPSTTITRIEFEYVERIS